MSMASLLSFRKEWEAAFSRMPFSLRNNIELATLSFRKLGGQEQKVWQVGQT
jgi:hypothetical protein